MSFKTEIFTLAINYTDLVDNVNELSMIIFFSYQIFHFMTIGAFH